MARKKAAAGVSTSPNKDSELEVQTKTDVSEEPIKAVRKVPAHPPTMDMVKEALKELDQRKGVSAQAIRSYIKEKYTTVDETRVKSMVRKALLKGIESGVFVRPVNSNTMTGAQGRFRLAVRKPKDAKPVKNKENSDPNTSKAKAGDVKKKSVTEKTKSDAAAAKVAPAKKPKAKRSAETKDPKSKAKTQIGKKTQSKSEKSGKSPVKKGGKKLTQKAEEGDGTEVKVSKKNAKSEDSGQEVATAAPKKGGRKVAQKAENGEQNAGAAPKAATRGKKVVEK